MSELDVATLPSEDLPSEDLPSEDLPSDRFFFLDSFDFFVFDSLLSLPFACKMSQQTVMNVANRRT